MAVQKRSWKTLTLLNICVAFLTAPSRGSYAANISTEVAYPSYRYLGCFKDKQSRALPDYYHDAGGTIDGCFQKALKLGYKIFAVQNGGECWLDNSRANAYSKYGVSDACINGTGAIWANSVYEIKFDISTSRPFVRTERKPQKSIPNTPATNEAEQQLPTPTTPVHTGGFDKNTCCDGSSTTIAAAVTASVGLLVVLGVIAILVIRRRRHERKGTSDKSAQCSDYDDVQADKQPKINCHETAPAAFADPSLAQAIDETCHRRCNQNGEDLGDNNKVISEYMKLYRKEKELYQSLTYQQSGRCLGRDERISDYENMEGPAQPYQVAGSEETEQGDQGAYADYEPMRDYVDVTT